MNDIAACAIVLNGVLPVAIRIEEGIVSCASGEDVVPRAAHKAVIPLAANEGIIAILSVEFGIAGSCLENIGIGIAFDGEGVCILRGVYNLDGGGVEAGIEGAGEGCGEIYLGLLAVCVAGIFR